MKSIETTQIPDLLREASLYRLLSVLFRPPTLGLASEIAALAASAGLIPAGGIPADVVSRLASLPGPDLDDEYHRTLGAAGPCPCGESDFTAATLAGKGGLIGDVAAFYKAFSFDPAAEVQESPDHVAIELSFLGWLRLKEAYALWSGREDEAALCRDAADKFTRDHLGAFLAAFLDRLDATARPDGFYATVSRLARQCPCLQSHSLAAGAGGKH